MDFGFSNSTDFSGTIYHENDEACNAIGQLLAKVLLGFWFHLFLLSVVLALAENRNWKFAWLVFGVASKKILLSWHMYSKCCNCCCPLAIVLWTALLSRRASTYSNGLNTLWRTGNACQRIKATFSFQGLINCQNCSWFSIFLVCFPFFIPPTSFEIINFQLRRLITIGDNQTDYFIFYLEILLCYICFSFLSTSIVDREIYSKFAFQA